MRAISITRALANYAEKHDCVFTINGSVESTVLLFGPEVFLPVVAMHANMNSMKLLGRPLGVDFSIDNGSLLGVSVRVDPLIGNEISALRIMFFSHAMHEIFGLSKDIYEIECEPIFHAYGDGLLNYAEINGEMKWPATIVSPR